jgi:hypothetical protein
VEAARTAQALIEMTDRFPTVDSATDTPLDHWKKRIGFDNLHNRKKLTWVALAP